MIQLDYDEKIKVKNNTLEIDYDFVKNKPTLKPVSSGQRIETTTFMTGYNKSDRKVQLAAQFSSTHASSMSLQGASNTMRPFTTAGGLSNTLSTPWAHARRKSGQMTSTGKTTAISTFYRPNERTTTAAHHKNVRWSQSIGEESSVILDIKGAGTNTSRD